MSKGVRIGLLAGAVVVLVLAFVLLPTGGDDLDPSVMPTTTGPATTPATPAGEAQDTTTAPASAPPLEEPTTIRVQGGQPDGGVQTITVEKGDRARIEVASQDTTDEIHLHGYDLTRELKAGDSVRFSFDADAEGVFEIELHGSGTKIGELVVEP